MPKLNARGDVICGTAGLPGSVNRRPYPFATYGRGCWRDDDTILVALISAGGALHGWQPFADPNGIAVWPVDPRGFNAIAGGGGNYGALVAGGAPVLFGTLGDLPGAGAADVALDGTTVYKTDYFAEYGLTLVAPDGTVRTLREAPAPSPARFRWRTAIAANGATVPIPSAPAYDYRALEGGKAFWPGGAYGRAPVRPYFPDAMNIKLATILDEDWLIYWSGAANAIVLHPDGASEGYLFVSSTMFDHDMIALGAELVVASSLTQGEGPNDLTVFHASRSGIRYVIGSGPMPAWGALATTPPEPEPPDPVPPDPHPEPPDPVPPDPEPQPPDPVPPDPPQPPEVDMTRMVVDTSAPILGADGEVITNGDGTISLKCEQGYLSLDSGGNWNFAPSIGPDECFYLGANGALVSVNVYAGRAVRMAAASSYEAP